jgi:peptidoglycan/LPS O-acetylase OafA/YrhL
MVYAPIVPLVLIQIMLRPLWPGIQNLFDDWANVAYYSTYLLLGALLAAWPALESALHRERKRALAVAGAATAVLFAALMTGAQSPSILLAGSAVAGWCFIVAALGFAHARLNVRSAWLDYLSESAFPVYLLHQTAIVFLGYGIVRLDLGIAPKFVLLSTAALAATLLTYHGLVRPFALPRWLLGMKPKACALRARPRVAPAPRAAAAILLVLLTAVPAAASTLEGRWYAEGSATTGRVCRGPAGR